MATDKLQEQLIKMSPLNILGADFHLVLHPKRWRNKGTPGTVNFPMAKIYLDTSLDDNRLIEILFHEILEVLVDRFTLKDLSHVGICALEFGIMEVFRNNDVFRRTIGDVYTNEGNEYKFEDFEEEGKTEPQSQKKALKEFRKSKKTKKAGNKGGKKKIKRVVEDGKGKG